MSDTEKTPKTSSDKVSSPAKRVSKPRAPKVAPVSDDLKQTKKVSSSKPKTSVKKVAPKVVEVEEIALDIEHEESGIETVERLLNEAESEVDGLDEEDAEKIYREMADEVYRNAEEEVYYLSNGTVLTPGYWQAWAGRGGRINIFSWLGLVTAFWFFPLGLLFSGLGIVNARAVPDDKFHKVLGMVGFAISAFLAFIVILQLILVIGFGVIKAFI